MFLLRGSYSSLQLTRRPMASMDLPFAPLTTFSFSMAQAAMLTLLQSSAGTTTQDPFLPLLQKQE